MYTIHMYGVYTLLCIPYTYIYMSIYMYMSMALRPMGRGPGEELPTAREGPPVHHPRAAAAGCGPAG